MPHKMAQNDPTLLQRSKTRKERVKRVGQPFVIGGRIVNLSGNSEPQLPGKNIHWRNDAVLFGECAPERGCCFKRAFQTTQ